MEPYQYMIWLAALLLGSFGAGCSLGLTVRTTKGKKTANARRK